MYALDLNSGEILWNFKTGDVIKASAVVIPSTYHERVSNQSNDSSQQNSSGNSCSPMTSQRVDENQSNDSSQQSSSGSSCSSMATNDVRSRKDASSNEGSTLNSLVVHEMGGLADISHSSSISCSSSSTRTRRCHRVAVASYDHHVYILSYNTTEFQCEGIYKCRAPVFSTPVFDTSTRTLYACDLKGYIHPVRIPGVQMGLNTVSQLQCVWSQPFGVGSPVFSSPALSSIESSSDKASSMLLIATVGNGVFGIGTSGGTDRGNVQGKIEWHKRGVGQVFSSIATTANLCCFGSHDGNTYILRVSRYACSMSVGTRVYVYFVAVQKRYPQCWLVSTQELVKSTNLVWRFL